MKTLGIFLGTIFLIGLFVVGGINGVIIADENVNASWSQVQNQYQRRNQYQRLCQRLPQNQSQHLNQSRPPNHCQHR